MINSVEELEDLLSTPSEALIKEMRELKGDILILGVGGKMGPSLAKLAARAIKEAGVKKKVIGVSRFSEPGLKEELESFGTEAISIDLLNDAELQSLPEVDNVIYMAGKKFGTTGQEHATWAMNTYLPGRVGEKFRNSKIVVFSSGNIYPFMPIGSGGADENVAPDPKGEYAQSCLGRERVFQYASHRHKTPLLIYRLNYAVDLRYGNLLEIAQMVNEEREIDLTSGHMNVIWQGDANEIALRSLSICEYPAKILNVTGPETISIRWAAEEFGKLLNKKPRFVNAEAADTLLNNAGQCHRIFGYPGVSLREMIELTAHWVSIGGETHNKPTHFQVRSGKF
jgi:DNA-binding Lrp family transcriptional regulator